MTSLLNMVLRIVAGKVFSICQEMLDISQTATAFHRIRPPFTIQSGLQQYFTRSFHYSAHRSFTSPFRLRSVVCGKEYDDSMIDLDNVCQIPTSCKCKWRSAFRAARELSVHSFPSLEKLFCTIRLNTLRS